MWRVKTGRKSDVEPARSYMQTLGGRLPAWQSYFTQRFYLKANVITSMKNSKNRFMVKKIIYIFLVSGVNYCLQSPVWRQVMFGVVSALQEGACSTDEGLVRRPNTMPSTTGARRAELNLFQDSLWSGLD